MIEHIWLMRSIFSCRSFRSIRRPPVALPHVRGGPPITKATTKRAAGLSSRRFFIFGERHLANKTRGKNAAFSSMKIRIDICEPKSIREVNHDFDTLAAAVLSSVVITSAGGWALKATIEKGIQLGVDRKLEKLRSDLRTREEEIKALRAGALAALSAKHEELDRRRIKAAEALWMATIKQSKYRTAISYVSILKISAIKKTVPAGGVGAHKVKKFAEMLWLSAGIETQVQPNESLPEVERLFVSEIAWAAFDALQAIGGRAGALLLALKTGVDLVVLKDESETNTALKSVLPHMAAYIDNYPEVAAYYLVDQLKDKILMELRNSFAGSEFDSAPLRQARQIMDFANNMSSELKEQIPAEFKNNTPPLRQ